MNLGTWKIYIVAFLWGLLRSHYRLGFLGLFLGMLSFVYLLHSIVWLESFLKATWTIQRLSWMFLSSMFLYQLWTFFKMFRKHIGFRLIFLLRILKNISLSFSDKLVVVFISFLLQFEHLPFILFFSFLFPKDRLFPDSDIRISQLLINFVIISNTIIVSLSLYSFFSHTTLIDNGDRPYSISNIDVYLCISPMLSLRVVPRLIVIIHLRLQV